MQPNTMKTEVVLEFFRRVLPHEGNYFLGSQKAGANYLNQDGPIPDLISLAAKATMRASEQRHVWYGTGSYTTARTIDACKEKRCFYADIDCGPSKAYPTVAAGMREFVVKSRQHNILPPTLIVISGNGFHPYWTLKESIDLATWRPVAEALENFLMAQAGLFIDPITKDAARLLRVPGSVNYKDPANPKSCHIHEPATQDYDYGLDDIRGMIGMMEETPDPNLPPRGHAVDNSDLSTGTVTAITPKSCTRVFRECPMYRNAFKTKGAGISEPLWQNQLLALCFTTNGDKMIHHISSGHASYSPKATEKKFAEKQVYALGMDGPPRCETFERHGATECVTCEHKGHIKNPMQLAEEPAVRLPHGYNQADSGVWTIGDEDTPGKLIFPYKIVGAQLIDMGTTEDASGAIRLDIQRSADHIVSVEVPSDTFGDLRGLSKIFGRHNITPNQKQFPSIQHFMQSWVQELAKRKQVVAPITQFGWRKANGMMGFTVGGQTFWSDRTSKVAPIRVDAAIGNAYHPKGSLEPWKHAVDYITRQGRPEYQVALASAFAAPLMRLTGVSGVLLSLMSPQSGTGKSTILKLAQAVWGDPVNGVNALNDTANAVAHKMGIINNLPAYWDELRAHADVKQFMKVVFTVTQGKEKSRMSGATGFSASGTWDTLIISASNESMVGHVDDAIHGSDAGRYRVFEIKLDHKGDANAVASQMFNNVRENYGHAGARYGKLLAINHEAIAKLVTDEQQRLNTKFNVKQEERFWVALMAALFVGAKIAKTSGLVDFDLRGLRRYLENEFVRHRIELTGSVESGGYLEIVKQYLASYAGNIVVSDTLRSVTNTAPNLVRSALPLPPYSAQYANVDKKYLIPQAAFKNWISRNRIGNYQGIIHGLDEMGAKIGHKAVIGGGISSLATSPRQRCILLDLTHPAFSDLDDDYLDD